ncbi:triose-phosphate isomerase [Thiothrix fructosivorans]|uniref:Triosephosphate isomerase n=1 Tax=Thiothrix fructosivorans TaxID=111770 RepID=A0A8B0SIP6_9GAMM|nr:triose-phosphate isomerase [Thiothrix fructosivorans]MBO0613590.1 triose-phosphate isomerase [Thiothrix fructosivorans]QTX10991.1 triose-phosphate isomerase [Thiothrix fructosivorans]
MRQKLVAGNWKLNGSKTSIESLMGGILAGLKSMDNVAVAVCPPYVYIPMTQGLVAGSPIGLGSQDIADQDAGAFTGEVSGAMLKEFGCTYAIVGHSERRAIYGEQDADTARKFAAARKQGIKPILCVGETLDEREAGITEAVVARQLDAVIALEGVEALTDGVIAYEPVWAIGTGKTASPQQAQDVHAFIRGKLAALNEAVAAKVQILYGGSVKGANAAELFAMPDIDGGLIGGAALDAQEFLAICRAGN